MTPTRLRECMEFLSMSDGQLIRLFGVDARLVRRWKSGARDMPADIEAWIERLVSYWESDPPPTDARAAARRFPRNNA